MTVGIVFICFLVSIIVWIFISEMVYRHEVKKFKSEYEHCKPENYIFRSEVYPATFGLAIIIYLILGLVSGIIYNWDKVIT